MASKSTHVRLNSFPSRSRPTALRVEEVLNKIKTSELSSGTSESICYGLCRLAELYQCMDDLLYSPTIQALSQQSNKKSGAEITDGSLKILDICGITKEVVSQFKENVRDLQSSLRRRKEDSSMESSLFNYICFRKKMKKDAKRSIAALRQSDQAIIDDEQNSSVIRVLREVNSTTVAIMESALSFLAASQPTSSKWALVSRLVNNGKVGCEEQESQNELESAYSALQSLCRNDQTESEKIQFVQNRLESLGASIDGIENGLEGICRFLSDLVPLYSTFSDANVLSLSIRYQLCIGKQFLELCYCTNVYEHNFVFSYPVQTTNPTLSSIVRYFLLQTFTNFGITTWRSIQL